MRFEVAGCIVASHEISLVRTTRNRTANPPDWRECRLFAKREQESVALRSGFIPEVAGKPAKHRGVRISNASGWRIRTCWRSERDSNLLSGLCKFLCNNSLEVKRELDHDPELSGPSRPGSNRPSAAIKSKLCFESFLFLFEQKEK